MVKNKKNKIIDKQEMIMVFHLRTSDNPRKLKNILTDMNNGKTFSVEYFLKESRLITKPQLLMSLENLMNQMLTIEVFPPQSVIFQWMSS